MIINMKRRTPLLYDDYSDLENNPSDPSAREKASRHLIYQKQKRFKKTSKLKAVETLLLNSLSITNEAPIVKQNRKGRPTSSITPNTFLAMLIWYRCNFEKKKYTADKKQGQTCFEKIADSIKKNDEQSMRAVVLDDGLSEVQRRSSENHIEQTNANFKKYGFILNDRCSHNETQAEIFCVCVLGLSVEEAATHKYELIDTWMRNFF